MVWSHSSKSHQTDRFKYGMVYELDPNKAVTKKKKKKKKRNKGKKKKILSKPVIEEHTLI